MAHDKEYVYYYPGTNISIKDVQNVELEILEELNRVCKLKNIPYQLAGGTLLGAVRHKGFIPWDDDIDVFMKRCDYERFLKEAAPEIRDKYFLQTCFTDPDSVVQFVKIRKNGTVFENNVDNLPTSHTGIWIDVFPLDNVKPGTLADWFRRFRIATYYGIITSSVKNRVKYCKSMPKKFLRFVFAGLLKVVPKRVFDKKLQAVLKKYSDCDTGYLAHASNGLKAGMQYYYVVPSDNYYNMIELEFCGKMYPVPANYDEVLKIYYGDYMQLPPEEKRHPEHGITRIKI